jgi:uncharacterized protein DUF6788
MTYNQAPHGPNQPPCPACRELATRIKINGKTVTRILTDDQLADYQPWFDNQRRLRALVAKLETLSQEIADNDPRWNR